MPKYRNTQTGRVLERPQEDEWLEASSGWTREDESAPAPSDNEHHENEEE